MHGKAPCVVLLYTLLQCFASHQLDCVTSQLFCVLCGTGCRVMSWSATASLTAPNRCSDLPTPPHSSQGVTPGHAASLSYRAVLAAVRNRREDVTRHFESEEACVGV